jgi:hypothetical protein
MNQDQYRKYALVVAAAVLVLTSVAQDTVASVEGLDRVFVPLADVLRRLGPAIGLSALVFVTAVLMEWIFVSYLSTPAWITVIVVPFVILVSAVTTPEPSSDFELSVNVAVTVVLGVLLIAFGRAENTGVDRLYLQVFGLLFLHLSAIGIGQHTGEVVVFLLIHFGINWVYAIGAGWESR